MPLPAEPYELAVWSAPKVHPDGHVTVEGGLYSVPWRLIGSHVDARATSRLVELVCDGELVKTHVRTRKGGKQTDWATSHPRRSRSCSAPGLVSAARRRTRHPRHRGGHRAAGWRGAAPPARGPGHPAADRGLRCRAARRRLCVGAGRRRPQPQLPHGQGHPGGWAGAQPAARAAHLASAQGAATPTRRRRRCCAAPPPRRPRRPPPRPPGRRPRPRPTGSRGGVEVARTVKPDATPIATFTTPTTQRRCPGSRTPARSCRAAS